MPKVFVAPGHGDRPDGRHDPGAVSGVWVEHDQNTRVADAFAVALRRCGIEVVLERGGGDHDPNFIGSTEAANRSRADYAVEVHHNAGGGTGTECLVNEGTSAANEQLAEQVGRSMADALGLPYRRVIARDREYFLRETEMWALIPECCFVDGPDDQQAMGRDGYGTTVAEAIAEPLCGFLGVRYIPPDQEDDMTKDEVKAAVAEVLRESFAFPNGYAHTTDFAKALVALNHEAKNNAADARENASEAAVTAASNATALQALAAAIAGLNRPQLPDDWAAQLAAALAEAGAVVTPAQVEQAVTAALTARPLAPVALPT